MRRLRVRLRTLLLVIAFLAMVMGMAVQYVQVQREHKAFERVLRLEAAAEAQLARTQARLDAMNAQSKKQQPQSTASAVKP